MATAGKIHHIYSSIEIDEAGKVWLIQNHFDSPSIIMEMESSASGIAIIDTASVFDLFDEEDYLD